MHIKIILPLLILLSFSAILILPTSWGICIPSGCSFNSNTCSNNSCIGETLNQQLSTSKLYVKDKLFNSSRTKLFNYLLEAFSDGILHPQIYSVDN